MTKRVEVAPLHELREFCSQTNNVGQYYSTVTLSREQFISLYDWAFGPKFRPGPPGLSDGERPEDA